MEFPNKEQKYLSVDEVKDYMKKLLLSIKVSDSIAMSSVIIETIQVALATAVGDPKNSFSPSELEAFQNKQGPNYFQERYLTTSDKDTAEAKEKLVKTKLDGNSHPVNFVRDFKKWKEQEEQRSMRHIIVQQLKAIEENNATAKIKLIEMENSIKLEKKKLKARMELGLGVLPPNSNLMLLPPPNSNLMLLPCSSDNNDKEAIEVSNSEAGQLGLDKESRDIYNQALAPYAIAHHAKSSEVNEKDEMDANMD